MDRLTGSEKETLDNAQPSLDMFLKAALYSVSLRACILSIDRPLYSFGLGPIEDMGAKLDVAVQSGVKALVDRRRRRWSQKRRPPLPFFRNGRKNGRHFIDSVPVLGSSWEFEAAIA